MGQREKFKRWLCLQNNCQVFLRLRSRLQQAQRLSSRLLGFLWESWAHAAMRRCSGGEGVEGDGGRGEHEWISVDGSGTDRKGRDAVKYGESKFQFRRR